MLKESMVWDAQDLAWHNILNKVKNYETVHYCEDGHLSLKLDCSKPWYHGEF
jgi:hypothetical protein